MFDLFFELASHSRYGVAFLVFLISAVVGWLLRRLMWVLSQASQKNEWVRSLGAATTRPILWVVLGYGSLSALALVVGGDPKLTAQEDLLYQVRDVYNVVVLALLLFRWKQAFEVLLVQRAEQKRLSGADRALVLAMSRLMSVAVFALSGFMVLDILGLPVQGLLAFGGVGALAVSWAAKDIVANFFGGLMIFINRPFARGEWIRSPNKNFEGVVEKIGWYMTQIRTFDRRPMFVPNQLFIDAILENPGRMYNRRIKFDLGIRYDDMAVLQAVREGIERMLKAHADIDHSQTLMVHFVEYGPYSLNINIYCFCRTTNWAEYRRVQEDVLLRVGQIVTDLGAEIAFPTQTLHLDPGLSPQSSQ